MGEANCMVCGKGRFSGQGQAICRECEPGTIASADRRECEDCSPGFVATSYGEHACVECAAGRIALYGLRCSICILGTFANKKGATKCTSCPARGVTCSADGTATIDDNFWRMPDSGPLTEA